MSSPFESFARNGEDVVLWRALCDVEQGRYVDIGANDPAEDSVCRAFDDHGWRGIAIAPTAPHAQITRETATPTRALDEVLAEAGWDGTDIHFVAIDAEGEEPSTFAGFELARWRPWVLVVQWTESNRQRETHPAWEHLVTAAGYRFCLFDGRSRYYVAPDHPQLASRLSYGASVHDHYTTLRQRELVREVDELRQQLERTTAGLELATSDVARWRSSSLTWWTEAIAAAGGQPRSEELQHLRLELDAIRHTVSWRVTAPLRVVAGRVRPVLTGRR